MRAIRFHTHGGPDVLTLEELPRPSPGPGEVLVAVDAAGINPVDTYFREGSYEPADLPWVPGSDVAGTVEAVGEGVEGVDVGDRVVATALGSAQPGTCAEFVRVPVDRLAVLPETVDATTAAAGALVGVTAWQTLVATADLEPGETCLIHGGSGGVGHVAVQLARTAGASVTTTASPAYHADLQALGATTTLDYAREDLAEAVVDAGEPDVILDHRLDEYIALDGEVAAQGARIIAIGNESARACFEDVPAWRGSALSLHHVSMFNTPDIAAVLERLTTLWERGDVTVEVAREYPLSETADAQVAVMEDSVLGKLVVRP
jgi:NADPH2:quinone reductase